MAKTAIPLSPDLVTTTSRAPEKSTRPTAPETGGDQLNLRIPAELRIRWKIYGARRRMTQSQVAIAAFEALIRETGE